MEYAVQTQDLSRTFISYEKAEGIWQSIRGFYRRKHIEKLALAPTTLKIPPGQIVGLVGANGAGKTTLLKLLSGLIHPSSGTATVLGFEPWQRKNEFLRQMSLLLGQKNQLWWDIPPSDSFALLAEIYDLDSQQARHRVRELAEILDCTSVLNTQLRRLSLGERMKMELIGSLLHKPRILFLDEPTIGLDIVAQTSIRKFLSEYVKLEGPTVILTSHYMDDIALLANQLLLISRGQIVFDGNVKSFTQKASSEQKLSFSVVEPLRESLSLGAGLSLPAGQQEFSLQVQKTDLPSVLAKVTQLPDVHSLSIEEADFEDVIRKFLEKESRALSPSRHHST